MEEDGIVNIKLLSIYIYKVVGLLDSFISFLKKYEEKIP
jgi:hypothetical protein